MDGDQIQSMLFAASASAAAQTTYHALVHVGAP